MSGTTSGVDIIKAGADTNLRVYCGKTLRFKVIWGGSTPIDISGYQASLTARGLDGEMLLDLDDGNGGILVDGPAGTLTIETDPQTTRRIRKNGRYELTLTTVGGEVYRVLSGGISPIEEVAP